MSKKRKRYMCDFETTTDPDDLRVWCACAVDIDTLEVAHISTSIDEFFEFLENENTVCYFHNERFDGEFILPYLFTHGFKYSNEKKDRTFSTVISDMGQFYSIEVIFKKIGKQYKKVVFYDSLKKLPFKVEKIAKDFNLPISKGSIDYTKPRPKGYEPTPEEIEYIITDCKIVATALQIQFAQNLLRLTIGGDAMHDFKHRIGEKRFNKYFPVLPIAVDDDIRLAYRGGYTFLNPIYANVRGLQGITFDVNSLYPSVMYNCKLPYGYPMYFEGAPNPDDNFDLFIVRLECAFDVKPNHLPTIQLKRNLSFVPTQYIESTNGDIVEMTLTSVDLALFLEQYDVHNLTYINGWKFRSFTGLFNEYIDFWMQIKENSEGALRLLAKLMLNNLYGKFATNPKRKNRIPYLDDEGIIRYKYSDEEINDPVYTAMGVFITAYARDITIRSAQRLYHRFIYCDTDSLHLIGFDEPSELNIHPTHLGAWKNEGAFTDSVFIRAKTYAETTEKGLKIACAGMPENVKEQVTYDNFIPGATFGGKLVPKRFKGGVILMPTTFTIK